jgi:hypothetical protein
MPFTTGLEMISKECAEPLAGEFRTAFEEQNFGLPLRDALLNLSDRVPIIDVKFFVTALMIQKETGGNLAEILDGLARVIRERFRIYRDVQVKTAQGRLTAGILIALPIAMLAVLSVLNPHYVGHSLYGSERSGDARDRRSDADYRRGHPVEDHSLRGLGKEVSRDLAAYNLNVRRDRWRHNPACLRVDSRRSEHCNAPGPHCWRIGSCAG